MKGKTGSYKAKSNLGQRTVNLSLALFILGLSGSFQWKAYISRERLGWRNTAVMGPGDDLTPREWMKSQRRATTSVDSFSGASTLINAFRRRGFH